MLNVRRRYQIYKSRQLHVPDVKSKGLLIMIHELPEELGLQVTAINFGPEPLEETVAVDEANPGHVLNMFTDEVEGVISDQGQFTVYLNGYEWKSFLLVS